ncbi:X-Pro dipeptidyl-peptidase [Kribbella sp. VKM Ac-2527]|uniref:X-Pro dipeptidyl-peptidase n=1 Tax=Kribbella caucasensis TaxID=2512215 RepID=A0A4R6JIG4_9ACTN|nr:CocE/NonD family hydrolase [Kribbella sp. VKM Ac-2527]TDO35829.1 X-Pro dipeptidyl-peptidase [Kribbella sp. VKM Ac-2527]
MLLSSFRRSRRATIAATAATVLAATALSPLPSGAAPPAQSRPFVSGTQTTAVYDYDNAIHERVSVEVPVDADDNGVNDRVMVDLIRPGEAAQAGVDVPVIIQASPYYASNPASYFDADGTRQVFNTWLDNYFVPRGYAVAFVDLIGTFRSSGCDDVGGDYEVAGGKAVIDWLNGRANGFTPSGSPVTADWSTGKAGMIGVSWNGTIANSVAGTGVEGLETIVPIAAISSWYDYTRSYGVPFWGKYVGFLHDYVSNDVSPRCPQLTKDLETASDSATGSYSSWWDPRNYRLDAANVRSSVYVVHGLNDENVKTRHFGEWWDELAKNGVPRKIFLHQDVHIDSFSYRDTWVQRLHPWFNHWLQGLDNGVMDTPMAMLQREDGTFTTEATWPAAGAQQTKLSLAASAGRTAGTLTTDAVTTSGTVNFSDRKDSDDDYVLDPTTLRSDRAVFLTNELTSAVRLSGTGTVKVRVQSSQPSAAIKARLVDYGPANRYTTYFAKPTTTCWGDGTTTDTGCYADTGIATAKSDLNVVARTMADIGHYKSLTQRESLQRGVWYDLSFELNADDAVFAAGHRIGLILTVEPGNPDDLDARRALTIDPVGSSLTLPLAGATTTLRTPGPAEPVPARVKAHPEPEKDPAELIRQFVDTSR